MPTLSQAQQLKEFAEEVFELSKDIWTTQSKSKGKDQAEITETEFLALDLLSQSQPLTVGDIQRKIGVLPAQMSRVIRSLENKSDGPLISCQINPADKRKIDVELTDAGYSEATIARHVAAIRMWLRWLHETGQIPENLTTLLESLLDFFPLFF